MALINFSGIASGIDSASLIQAYLDQQRNARVKPLETKRAAYDDTNLAFGELKTLLDDLYDAAQGFRALNGGAIKKIGTSSDETIVSATASNSAQNGTYSLTVTQRAKTATFSYNDRYSDPSTVLNSAINNGAAAADRTVTYTVGTGSETETVSVVLTNTTTAQDFVASFNEQSEKANASLVNVGTAASPSYAIVLNSNNEGTSKGTILQTAIGSELAAGAGALQTSTTSQALDATFTVSGITGSITRSSNTVTDVISGVSLSLNSLGTTQLSVISDPETTASGVQTLVDAFNEVVRYVAEKDRITQEQADNGDVKNIFGALSNTTVDENLISALRSALTGSSITGGGVNTLADLGITTERDGTLKFDSDTFIDGLNSDPVSAEEILTNLGEALGAVDGTIAQYTRYNGVIDSAVNGNADSIRSLDKQISEVEKSLSSQEASLTRQYARLEGLIGQLNSQQSVMASILPR